MDLTWEQLGGVLVTVAATIGLCLAARRRPGPWIMPVAGALGILLVLSEAAWIPWLVAHRGWSADVGLPLHLCDAATLLAAAALWTRKQQLVELTYFWACAGTVQALVTPDVPEPFPSFVYFQYYSAHGGVVVAALFLVIGLRMAPGKGAVVRAALATAGYTAAVGLVDVVTGGNYMFLREPPPTPSLLDVMGPWPWYLATATVLGVVLFATLNLPFWLTRRRAVVQAGATPRDRERRDRTNGGLPRIGNYAIARMRLSRGSGTTRSYKCVSPEAQERRDRTNAYLPRLRDYAMGRKRRFFG